MLTEILKNNIYTEELQNYCIKGEVCRIVTFRISSNIYMLTPTLDLRWIKIKAAGIFSVKSQLWNIDNMISYSSHPSLISFTGMLLFVLYSTGKKKTNTYFSNFLLDNNYRENAIAVCSEIDLDC